MKRNIFYIDSSLGRSSRRYSWNSALKEMVEILKQEIKDLPEVVSIECTDKEVFKIGEAHNKGRFTWKTDKGHSIIITIEKE